jgi:hypothetical protein
MKVPSTVNPKANHETLNNKQTKHELSQISRETHMQQRC